jgi:hypothetical protein
MAEKRKCEQDMAKCTTDRKHYVELRCRNNDQHRSFKLREVRQEGTKEGRKIEGFIYMEGVNLVIEKDKVATYTQSYMCDPAGLCTCGYVGDTSCQ